MDRREKLVKAVSAKLTVDQRRLLKLLAFENHKNVVTVRMPQDVISLEEVWGCICETSKELSIPISRAGTFATLEELDAILTDISWLWHGWLPRGFVSMLVGDPGVGKSVTALDWVRIVTNGTEWPLEAEKASASNVVWIDTEASQQLLNIRSKRLGVDRSRVSIPVIDGDILAQVNVIMPEHREQILSIIEAKKPSLLVLDSLSGSHNRGENRVEDIKPIMEFFALVARDYDLSVLAIHHLRKGSPGESPEINLYRIRGSIAIPQFARSIISLENMNEGTTKLRVIKSNLARIAKPIIVTSHIDTAGDIMGMTYALFTPPPPKRSKKEMCAEWVMQQLKNSTSEVGVALKTLEDAGMAFGYTRGNLYSAKEILGDRIAVTGTGRTAYWHLANDIDKSSVQIIITANGDNNKHDHETVQTSGSRRNGAR